MAKKSKSKPAEATTSPSVSLADALAPADRWMSHLNALLKQLEDLSADATAPPLISRQTDNELIQVRLGIAAALFAALRCKDPASAAHALRVALSASVWSLKLGLSQKERDCIEIAALLHDIGVIGIPDRILLKPGPLAPEEAMAIERSRHMSLEILRAACAEPVILEIVENVSAWYNGSKEGNPLRGEAVPLGARMIAILESFDAMTTDHVFRPAMSRERALSELFEYSGSQFDPELVKQFAELQKFDHSPFRREVAYRWFRSLDPEVVDSYWELNRVVALPEKPSAERQFQDRLLENMHDAVVFVDADLKVQRWNHGAERLTGISSGSILQRHWTPGLLNTRDEKGQRLSEADCPVAWASRSGVQSLRRLTIRGRSGGAISVDSHAIPVFDVDGAPLGAILLLHDASSEITLEERCQNLAEKAAKDPLTQVANRAEFDRVHEMFVAAHLQQQLPCSLVICDLDHFKQVNDTFGHQAGDEVIKSLAALLKSSCRPGDLVARYGGEEFVVLCADCDNATAAVRAEQVRRTLSQKPQSWMAGQPVTASFGVTEVQPGDTAETMLRRADRALLEAKAQGRNRVVQLGSGSDPPTDPEPKRRWARKPAGPKLLLETDLLTGAPISVTVEKLRGFVADHQAKVNKIEGNHVQLELEDNPSDATRRRNDRPVTFTIDLRFEEVCMEQSSAGQSVSRTRVRVAVYPKSSRDRRRDDLAVRAQRVLSSFRSYLIATEDKPALGGVLRSVKQILTPWLAKH